jgi:uncharacterized protein (DUF1778 family)
MCPYNVRTCKGQLMATDFPTMESLASELRQESRSERMEQRVKPTIKQAIELAATLAGTDTSEFVTTAAFQAAMDRIRDMRRMQLSGEEAEKFFAALERPRSPTQELRELMDKHDALVEED